MVAFGAAVVVLAGALAGGLALAWRTGEPPTGTIVVVATVARPVPAHLRLQVEPTAIALRTRGGWRRQPIPVRAVQLPGQAVAPGEATLVELRVPAGRYEGVAFSWRAGPGDTVATARRRAVVQVARGGLTPILFTLRLRDGAPLAVTAAYAGNTEINFGLQAAAGTLLAVPTAPLVDAAGHPMSLRRDRGHVVVLASFLTECQETCPLVDAALVQVWRQLVARGLQGRVRVVLVTQEPQVDTPVALGRYARHFRLPFTLLTGPVARVNRFWAALRVPLPDNMPIAGRQPIDPFTGRRETTNPLHTTAVMVIDPKGDVVSELLGQPTLRDGVPAVIARYLDAQGRTELRSGGSWTPSTVVDTVLGILQEAGIGAAFPRPPGATAVARVGRPAPAFSLRRASGGRVTLAALRGYPVVLDFWASWCVNCRRELPLLAAAARRDRARGLRLVLVNYQQGAATAAAYLRRLGIPGSTLLDPTGQVATRFGVVALPVTAFLTPAGVVAGIQVGQLTPATLAAQLRPILRPAATGG